MKSSTPLVNGALIIVRRTLDWSLWMDWMLADLDEPTSQPHKYTSV
jgi:hypothetical protein